MAFDSSDVVAGTGINFILQNGLLNNAPTWPSDVVVDLYLAPPGPQPFPPNGPVSFAGARGYRANTYSVTGSGLQASYTAVPCGSGYAGDLDVSLPGYWARWWYAYSVSTGLDTILGYGTFLVKPSPRTAASVSGLP